MTKPTLIISEKYDFKAILYILQNQELFEGQIQTKIDEDTDILKDDPLNNLKHLYTSLVVNDTHSLPIKYEKATGETEGRWFAKQVAYQNMYRVLRHTIAKKFYKDFDFKNCHPTILLFLCVDNNINVYFLKKYVEDRDKIFNKMMKCRPDYTKEDCKISILKVMNGKSLDIPEIDWWDDVKKEFQNIAKSIAELPIYSKILKKKQKTEKYNIYAKVMNKILCDFENECLEISIDIFKQHKIVYSTLQFDGLSLELNDKLNNDLLREIQSKIKSKKNIDLICVYKELDEFLHLPDDYINTEDTNIIVRNDAEACFQFIKHNKNILKKCQGVNYIYEDGLWKTDKFFNDGVFNRLKEMNLQKPTRFGLEDYSKNYTTMEKCFKLILKDNSYADELFCNKLWESNLYKLSYNNGVYFFKTKEFKPYPVADVMSVSKIPFDFTVERDENVIQEIYDRLLNPVFPDKIQRQSYLRFISRGLAGHIEDKQYAICCGERNSSKSVLNSALKNCFEVFVGQTNANNFIHRELSSDPAKANSWIVDFEFKRLALSDEIQCSGKTKLDGIKVKMFSSGGDIIEGRKNHKDERNFKIQARSVMNMNATVPIDPVDAKETCVVFNFRTKFIPAEKIDDTNKFYCKPADPSIKEFIKTPEFIVNFTHILLDHYTDEPLKLEGIVLDDTKLFQNIDDKEDVMKVILKYFEITNSEEDRIKSSEVKKYKDQFEDIKYIKISDIKEKLVRLGSKYKENMKIKGISTSGYTHIKLINHSSEWSKASTYRKDSISSDCSDISLPPPPKGN